MMRNDECQGRHLALVSLKTRKGVFIHVKSPVCKIWLIEVECTVCGQSNLPDGVFHIWGEWMKRKVEKVSMFGREGHSSLLASSGEGALQSKVQTLVVAVSSQNLPLSQTLSLKGLWCQRDGKPKEMILRNVPVCLATVTKTASMLKEVQGLYDCASARPSCTYFTESWSIKCKYLILFWDVFLLCFPSPFPWSQPWGD